MGRRLARTRGLLLAGFMVCLESAVILYPSGGAVLHAAQSADTALQEHGDALIKNVEEMVAHGGMGDAKAIVHHCEEAARHAEALLTKLPVSDPRGNQASIQLKEVIQQCKRVSEIGIHADPGQLLNPAIKARAAARESIKLLGLVKVIRN